MQAHLVSKPKKERNRKMSKDLLRYEEDNMVEVEGDGQKTESVLDIRRDTLEPVQR